MAETEKSFSLIFQLYKQQFLNFSILNRLVNPDRLALAGDITSVRTAAHQWKSTFAIVKRKAVLLVTANAIIPNPTVTGDGNSLWECYSNFPHYFRE